MFCFGGDDSPVLNPYRAQGRTLNTLAEKSLDVFGSPSPINQRHAHIKLRALLIEVGSTLNIIQRRDGLGMRVHISLHSDTVLLIFRSKGSSCKLKDGLCVGD